MGGNTILTGLEGGILGGGVEGTKGGVLGEGVEGTKGGVLGVLGGGVKDEDDDADALPIFIAANMASPICAAVGDGGKRLIIA